MGHARQYEHQHEARQYQETRQYEAVAQPTAPYPQAPPPPTPLPTPPYPPGPYGGGYPGDARRQGGLLDAPPYPQQRPASEPVSGPPFRLPPAPAEPRKHVSKAFAALLMAAVVLAALGFAQLIDSQGWNPFDAERSTDVAVSAPVAQPSPVGPKVLGPVTAARVAAAVTPAVVNINTEIGYQGALSAGTGIVLDQSGVVLTNNHVINGATSIKGTVVGNGRTYKATVIGYDRGHDVAVIQLRGASGLQAAKIGNSESLDIGDQVAAVGNAGGKGGKPTVSNGSVTALGRSIAPRDELTGSIERLTGLIEVAADVRPGDSGGPLVNAAGEVVGVDTAASASYRYQATGGTGFAIPINAAMAIARDIRGGAASDDVHIGPTGMLGVTVLGSSNPLGRTSDGYQVNGLPVASVASGTPAEDAGLVAGDSIVSLNETDLDTSGTLTDLIGRMHPGDKVRLVWVDRSGRAQSATVPLMEGPPN
jgi:S1-C subfamily serine protease